MIKTASTALLYASIACLTACASLDTTTFEDRQVEVDSHLLLAETALERQRFETGAREMLEAAMVSDHPSIAERATRLAQQLDLNDVGLRAVARWRELAPEDERLYWFSGLLETRAGRLDRASAHFTAFVDRLDDPGAGLALVLEGLADEPSTQSATTVMRRVVAEFPGTAEGHYALARLAMRSGDFDLALDNAATATELEPEWLEAQLLYARTLLIAGRTSDSLAIGARLTEEHDSAEVRLQYAELLLSAGRSAEAEALLNDILADQPGMPEAVRALAFLELTEGRLDTAEQRFSDLRGDPRYRAEAFYYLGRIAETEQDYLQATRHYSRVTDGTHAVEAQLRTARILLTELGNADGAVRHLQDFGAANPRFGSEMLVAQARLLLQMDRTDEAEQLFEDALAANPSDQTLQNAHVDLYVALAQDAQERGGLMEAESLLDEGLLRYPGNVSLRYSQALLYEEQGRMRKAANLLEDLVDENPDNSALLNALGYLLTDQFNRHTEARAYIQKALAMDPDNPAIIDSMGWVLFRLGQYEASLDYLERAFRLFPDPEVAAHLVDVHWALGDHEQALDLLEMQLEQHPDSRHLLEVSRRLSR